ncbi:MAG TPA: NADH dehydrogenase ubiquinone Fe-S protein 4, partial [Sphingomicrobium sp.]|nr:NADH dehydrogenase ubiquinone Fe-S protein 4 [Sphingomicrobium sp.]
MTTARIVELERKTTQSGKANAGLWLLEFERQEAQRPDPLTGWNGSGDTNTQVRINFQTKEAAVAYCEKHGL